MMLTTAQTTAFFENADQMGIQHATVVQLAQEVIQSVDDLADFHKDALQQLADNLQGGGVGVGGGGGGGGGGGESPQSRCSCW